jgi:SAM-dependent methyltransferase
MAEQPSNCRFCAATRLARLGDIPDSDYFAGRVLPAALAGGSLWRCLACESMFRHPVLSPSAYLDLYANGPADSWGADSGRKDLAIIRRIIAQQHRAARVLDVGCGDGGFLSTLPPNLQKCGVEPSAAAVSQAKRLGVSVLGQTLGDLPAQAQFDVITVIDVIEHVADPAELLDQALSHLSPGGCLIVSTGDPDNAFWRKVFRARFWYSCFPEHVSFPSLRFFQLWQQSKGLRPPQIVRTRYRQLPFWRKGLSFAAQALYMVSPACLDAAGRCLQRLRAAPRPRRRCFSPGSLGVFTDHQVVTIQRPI